MINHARTLLLNIDGNRIDSFSIAADYVSPDFKSVLLPKWAEVLHSLLFGSRPEQNYLNYRVYECLQILHSTEYSNYVLDLDSRVTYDLDFYSFGGNEFGTTVDNSKIEVIGADSAIDGAGVAKKMWTVITSSPAWTIRLYYPEVITIMYTPVVTAGKYRNILLPLSNIVINADSDIAVDVSFHISSLSRPKKNWVDFISKLFNYPYIMDNLFKIADKEPFITFNKLWNSDLGIQYRLSGLLLAYVYRLEELRLNVK